MRFNPSIRARLVLGAALVLLAFIGGVGVTIQRANADGVRAAHFARLQSTGFLLLAEVEMNESGALVMPETLADARLSLPGSGLYASVLNVERGQEWRSGSTVGVSPPFHRAATTGEWRYDILQRDGKAYLGAAYGAKWAARTREFPLVFSVVEDMSVFDREIMVFSRTLWGWLGGAGLLLLVSQTLLLRWGLSPLRRVAQEISSIEKGAQTEVQGRYPAEIAALTGNINTLIRQERVRQKRYREALSFLAHSLKTPLAVLRTTLDEPAQLRDAVSRQVARMDDIVHHQLTRAAATGSAHFAASLPLAPILHRIRDSLDKVYAEKGLAITVECPPDLDWRIDEGDAFEILGNVMDNAAKWARRCVAVQVWREKDLLNIRVQDDGPGFSDTQSILQIHVRMDERVPGHGVGLAVVSDLVASHHGEMKLSRAQLGGAQVDIVLPSA